MIDVLVQHQAMRKTAILYLLLAACGGGGGSKTDGSTDTMVFHDAPPNVPAMITISGTTKEVTGLGQMNPLAGVVVEAHKASDDSLVTMTTSDAQGNYSLTITTNGVPVDGYLKATKATYADTYLFPPAPLIANFSMGSVNCLMPSTIDSLYAIAGVAGGHVAGMGTVALEVFDAAGMPVTGATISSTPAYTYRYGNPPLNSNTSTQADGIAAVLNAAPGSVSLSATKTGTTFHSHSVKVFANAFTTTIIQP